MGQCHHRDGAPHLPGLADAIRGLTGEADLAFFDAIAPIVHHDSIDFDIAWMQSRYDKPGPGGTGKDYINCPLDRAQYDSLHRGAVDAAKKHHSRNGRPRTPYFDGCLPIEVMAERGARNAAAWADEAARPHQCAPADREALCGRAIAPG